MTAGSQPESGSHSLRQTENRRRSPRLTIGIPVTVLFERDGVVDKIPARTISVNNHGALLMCSCLFPTNAQMDIESALTNQRRHCRVPSRVKVAKEGFEVPIELDGPSDGFWGISFPDPPV